MISIANPMLPPFPKMLRNPESSPVRAGDTLNSARPTSAHTIESTFADSAIDMNTTTPVAGGTCSSSPDLKLPTPDTVDQSLSDKMRQLAAVVWALEQDDGIHPRKRKRLQTVLMQLEDSLEEEDVMSPTISGHEVVETDTVAMQPEMRLATQQQAKSDGNDQQDEWIDEVDLLIIRDNLAATVHSMRLRQQEHRHLHELTMHKLEAVAQRCLAQEQEIRGSNQELESLRQENQTLGQENDHLRERAAILESESLRKEVAVTAMTSAVAGLEGWLDEAEQSRQQQLSTPSSHGGRPRKVIIRGKGRFRGRYYAEVDRGVSDREFGLDGTEDAEIHDGVKAWLRGFKDVEEEMRRANSPASILSKEIYREQRAVADDDWGDFQTSD